MSWLSTESVLNGNYTPVFTILSTSLTVAAHTAKSWNATRTRKTQNKKSFHLHLSSPWPLKKVLEKYIWSIFLSLSWFDLFFSVSLLAYVSIGYVSVWLPVCLSQWGYTLGLWQRSLPFSSNWPAPLSPCLLDNWTCNPNPRTPIIGSLQPPLHSTHFSSQCESLCGPVFDHWIKGNIQSYTVQTHCGSVCYCLAHNTKYQYEMDFYVQYIASNISLHYLNPWRQRASISSCSTWRTR